MKNCMDCNKKITSGSKTGRCQSCAAKKRIEKIGSPNYIDGRSLKKYYCKDCGIEINYRSKRCIKCNYKTIENKERFSGKNNPKWKGGISKDKNYIKKKLNECFLKRYHNLTIAEYNKLLKKQNYKCIICRDKPIKKLFVDHNHKTKKIRGLLCVRCNSAIGFIREDIKIAQKIIKYLKKNEKERNNNDLSK